MQNISKFFKDKQNLRKFAPVIIILIALPLIVLLSLQQQELRQRAASVDCNNGLTCGACSASSNTCSYGNGLQSCTYTTSLDGSACIPKTYTNVYCFVNNCSAGFTCSNQQCVSSGVPTATPSSCSGTLQSKIDAAAAGSTLNLTGCSFTSLATVNKPLTIIGGTLTVGAATRAITVTASNVTIDSMTIIGPVVPTTIDFYSYGVWVNAPYTNPVANLTVKNCTIKKFGWSGIEVHHVTNLKVQNCDIEDAAYAGILTFSAVGGNISGNTIRRVGYHTALNTPAENNAYGIALSRNGNSNYTTDPRSSNFVVDGNLIEDVPYWHCLDTHAGDHITFSNNTTRRCPRALFITGTAYSADRPMNITVTGNRLEQALQVSGGTNTNAITLVNLQTGTITNNAISTTYPAPHIYDYLGSDPAGSKNVTISGNTTIP